MKIIKKENTLKRERASKKLIDEFNITNVRVAEIFNVSKQRINDTKNKSNIKEYDEMYMYFPSNEDINVIKRMVQDGKYAYNDNKYKIEIINDLNGKFAIILQNIEAIEEIKIFFSDDINNDTKWKEIIYIIHKHRLDVLQFEEKIIIDTGERVYVTAIPFFRPNYKLFHKYKNIRNLNEDDYIKFLGLSEYRFIPKKYEYTDDKIKDLIKKDIANNKMKIIDGKLYIPSKSWLRNRCSRQEEQLTGKHLSFDEFVRVYGYEQYDNRDRAIDISKLMNLAETEIAEVDSILRKNDFTASEKDAIVKVRVGQGYFKKMLLEKYEGKCCICNLSNRDLLIGSHIKEWKDSDFKEKCDVNNGLLLCSLHDSLFDKHLISFDNNGNIIISEKLSLEDRKILEITQNIKIDINEKMEYYMAYHRGKLK